MALVHVRNKWLYHDKSCGVHTKVTWVYEKDPETGAMTVYNYVGQDCTCRPTRIGRAIAPIAVGFFLLIILSVIASFIP